MEAMMRLALDATPLLEPMSGIPRYCRELVAALDALPSTQRPDMTLVAFSWSGRPVGPPGVRISPRRLPARVLRAAWSHSSWPPVELLSGSCDVFHGTNFLSPPTRRAASVVTVHDLAFLTHPTTVRRASRGYAGLLGRAVRRPRTVVVTPSEAVRAEVVDLLGADPHRVVATPLGVDTSGWPTSPDRDRLHRLGLVRSGSRPYSLFVGTAEPRKNLATLMAAHAMARGRDSDTPDLVVVGGAGWGEQSPDTPGVLRLGRLSEADLRAVVAGSTALLLPSLAEGFGLPVLEASAAGRPLVLSDLPVLREVAPADAVFVAATDVDGWAKALAHLGAGGAGDTAQARTARREHAATFTWARCASATLHAYRTAQAL